MNSYLETLLKSEEKAPLYKRAFLYFYMTHMSIPLFVVYMWLVYISCGKISDIQCVFASILGGVFFVITIFSLAREHKEVGTLRARYFEFIDKLTRESELSKLNEDTKIHLREFSDLFVRVCPRATKPKELE